MEPFHSTQEYFIAKNEVYPQLLLQEKLGNKNNRHERGLKD